MEDFKVKTIIKLGNSLGLPLTKEFQKLNVKKGDYIYVKPFENIIIVTNLNNLEKMPLLVDKEKLRKLKTLIYNHSKFNSFDNYIDYLLNKEIDKWKNWWSRPAL